MKLIYEFVQCFHANHKQRIIREYIRSFCVFMKKINIGVNLNEKEWRMKGAYELNWLNSSLNGFN